MTDPKMTTPTKMELAALAEQASWPDRELDAAIAVALFDGGGHADSRDDERARLPRFSHGARPGDYEIVAFSGVSLRAAELWTTNVASRNKAAACLRALAAQEDHHG